VDTGNGRDRALRIVTFNILPFAYRVVADWAERHGHELALVVTTPGPASRRNVSYREIVAGVPPTQEVVVTSKVGRLAPYLAALAPDLVVSFTFPYLIPPAITALPRLGAINLHPTPLPRYRGPNPLRQLYDGATTLGATLHRTEAGFDTGAILSQQERPLPDELTPERLGRTLAEVSAAALEEGAARAIAGEPGTPQDHAGATYAARFGAEDDRLAWDVPGRLLACRVLALLMAGHEPRIALDGADYAIRRAQSTVGPDSAAPPGGVLARAGDTWTIGVADGAVEVVLAPPAAERPASIF